ncbi:MAG: N-acetylglucosamine kinase [Hyphobacterium sp.]|nr:MAG: N-acetylglucosamine kinase [Hyphobacterium sp.]
MIRIGVDIGGTKTEVAAIDSLGHTRFLRRWPTPSPYLAKIELIAKMVHLVEISLASDSFSIGIGHPGSINPASGLVRNSNSAELNGKPLKTDLETALGRPVRCANDANCFALSEAIDGAGQDARSVFGIILGTGVGGGFALDGTLQVGHGLIGGEWGHVSLGWPRADEVPGPLCKCGLSGCVESWLSGPGLATDHARTSSKTLTAKEIVTAAERGDERAKESLQRYFDRLARSLATVINIIDPDVIVLGGGLSNIPNLADEVFNRLPAWVFSDQITTRISQNRHGDSSGVRGAAWLWPLE